MDKHVNKCVFWNSSGVAKLVLQPTGFTTPLEFQKALFYFFGLKETRNETTCEQTFLGIPVV